MNANTNVPLSGDDRKILLNIAREALQAAADRTALPVLQLEEFSDDLQQNGASFVTLMRNGQLRGCIGTLEVYQSLALDVQEHSAAAAAQDYRFSPVKPAEVDSIQIEISRLTPTRRLPYSDWQELITLLRPGVDGVMIRDGARRATFLPQVWEKLPDPNEFLTHLCLKLGADGNYWQKKKLDVFIYQVEEFRESQAF